MHILEYVIKTIPPSISMLYMYKVYIYNLQAHIITSYYNVHLLTKHRLNVFLQVFDIAILKV